MTNPREVVADALPELPEPGFVRLGLGDPNDHYYTADQMREYARAAIAATTPAASEGVEERARELQQNGARPLRIDRDLLGRLVREEWVRWAREQPNPKPSWLLPYDELAECDKEADRRIGEAAARWAIIHDAAHAAALRTPAKTEGGGGRVVPVSVELLEKLARDVGDLGMPKMEAALRRIIATPPTQQEARK